MSRLLELLELGNYRVRGCVVPFSGTERQQMDFFRFMNQTMMMKTLGPVQFETLSYSR